MYRRKLSCGALSCTRTIAATDRRCYFVSSNRQNGKSSGKNSVLEDDIKAWVTMRNTPSVTPSLFLGNKAIHAYGKLQQWEHAVAVLRDMKQMHIRRNVVSFSSAIHACAKGKKTDTALHLLDDMKLESITPENLEKVQKGCFAEMKALGYLQIHNVENQTNKILEPLII